MCPTCLNFPSVSRRGDNDIIFTFWGDRCFQHLKKTHSQKVKADVVTSDRSDWPAVVV